MWGEPDVLIFGALYVLLLVAYFAVRIMIIRLGLRGESFLGNVLSVVAIAILGSLIAIFMLIALDIAPNAMVSPGLKAFLLVAALLVMYTLLKEIRLISH